MLTIIDRVVEQGFLPRRPPNEPARGAISVRSAVRARKSASSTQGPEQARGPRSPEVHAMTDERSASGQRRPRARRHPRRPRRHACRRGGGRHREDDRARESDSARARTGRDDDGRNRRRHIHGKGRWRAEAASARSDRDAREAKPATRACAHGSTRRSSGSRKRTSTRSTASAPSCFANVRSKRESIRSLRVLTEPQADHLYTRAFQAWLQEALAEPARGRPPRAAPHERAVVRRHGRRRRPVDRLRASGPDARRMARLSAAVAAARLRSRGSDRGRARAAARPRRPHVTRRCLTATTSISTRTPCAG